MSKVKRSRRHTWHTSRGIRTRGDSSAAAAQQGTASHAAHYYPGNATDTPPPNNNNNDHSTPNGEEEGVGGLPQEPFIVEEAEVVVEQDLVRENDELAVSNKRLKMLVMVLVVALAAVSAMFISSSVGGGGHDENPSGDSPGSTNIKKPIPTTTAPTTSMAPATPPVSTHPTATTSFPATPSPTRGGLGSFPSTANPGPTTSTTTTMSPTTTQPPTPWIPQQVAKRVANDRERDDRFGNAVAINGNIMVVGAMHDNENGGNSGCAYVYIKVGTEWTSHFLLKASDGAPNDHFGYSVAVDSNTIVVGAPGNNDPNVDIHSGSVYVFVRVGNRWDQQAKLTPGVNATGWDEFGCSLAIDNGVVVVGARNSTNGNGSVHIYSHNNGEWNPRPAPLMANDTAAGAMFGYDVDIYNNTIVVGAPYDDHAADGTTHSGSVYVISLVDSGGTPTWIQQDKLKAADASSYDSFGTSVAIYERTIVAGAPFNDDRGTNSGSAYVFFDDEREGWTQQTKLLAVDGYRYDLFGASVCIYGDWVVVGAPDEGSERGSAYFFFRLGTSWIRLETPLRASDWGYDDYFGLALAIGDGTIIIGAPGDYTDRGSVYVWEFLT